MRSFLVRVRLLECIFEFFISIIVFFGLIFFLVIIFFFLMILMVVLVRLKLLIRLGIIVVLFLMIVILVCFVFLYRFCVIFLNIFLFGFLMVRQLIKVIGLVLMQSRLFMFIVIMFIFIVLNFLMVLVIKIFVLILFVVMVRQKLLRFIKVVQWLRFLVGFLSLFFLNLKVFLVREIMFFKVFEVFLLLIFV